MNVCAACFENQTLKDFVVAGGKAGYCDLCEAQTTHVVDAVSMRELFEPLRRYYRQAEEGSDYFYDNEDGVTFGETGRRLPTILLESWSIFANEIDDEAIDGFVAEVWPEYEPGTNYVADDHDRVEDADEVWDNLSKYVTHSRRFFTDPKDPDYVDIENVLGHLVEDFSCDLPVQKWYRARKHPRRIDRRAEPTFSEIKMQAPPIGIVNTGRANPAGISYLYLASDIETAAAEVRGEPDDIISIATCGLPEDLRVANLVGGAPGVVDPFRIDHIAHEFEKREFIDRLARSMSQFVRHGEHELDYVPTQYLAEYLVSKGFDGLLYPSAMSKGTNLVVFYPGEVNIVKIRQFRIKRATILYEISGVTDSERVDPNEQPTPPRRRPRPRKPLGENPDF